MEARAGTRRCSWAVPSPTSKRLTGVEALEARLGHIFPMAQTGARTSQLHCVALLFLADVPLGNKGLRGSLSDMVLLYQPYSD